MSKIKDHRIRKFNPGAFQSDEEVIAQFKVRRHELQTVLDILRDNIESPSCQHTLVMGPRGRGKTMLLARTAAGIRSDKELSENLLPVRFMEESQEIFNMADFWLETLFYLARECQKFDPELAQELEIRHTVLSQKWRNEALEDLARNAVLDVADQLDRKLVMMIENFQALFEDVDMDFGWKLRKVLQTEPQIMLVASATSRFKELDNAKLPFFEFFWIIDLKPLNTAECRSLWAMISGQEMSGREIRPLEILTGGSPRLLVILASFARHKSMRQLMEELVILIDEHTDYFRGNLEVLAKTERRVFLAVIDLWQSSTPSEISARARMDIRKVSTMLGRLVHRGAVIVEGRGRKRKYAAAERLYSIYYKLRRNRDEATVVQNLIHFMSIFYTEAEQIRAFSLLMEEMGQSTVIRDALGRVMAEDPELAKKFVLIAGINVVQRISRKEHQRIGKMMGELFENGDFAQMIQIADQLLSSDAPALQEPTIAWVMQMKAAAHEKQGNLDSALSCVSEIISRWDSAKNLQLQHSVAGALIIRGEVFQAQGKTELALLTVDEIVRDFGDKNVPYLQGCVACALLIKGEILQDQHNRNPAIEAFDEAVMRLDAVESQEFQWCIARALTNKGKLLRIQNQLDSALSTFEEVMERFDIAEDTELQCWVGWALIYKGELLQEQGDLKSALSTFENVIRRFHLSQSSELQSLAARSLIKKAQIFWRQDQQDSALSTFEEVVKCFGAKETAKLQNLVAQAFINKGAILQVQGQFEPALSAFEGVIERLSTAKAPDLKIMVSFAFLHKIMTLCASRDPAVGGVLSAIEEGIGFINAVEEMELSNGMRLVLQKNLVAMWTLKHFVLQRKGELGHAKIAFQKLTEHFDFADSSELQVWSIGVLIDLTELQTSIGYIPDALHTCNEITRRLSEVTGHEKVLLIWEALRVRMNALLIQKDLSAAVDSFRSLYAVLDPDNGEMIRVTSNFVIHLIAAGVAPRALIEVISDDSACAEALRPIIVALQQEAGETVRAPGEILEIASDIRSDIQKQRASLRRGEGINVGTPSQQASSSDVV